MTEKFKLILALLLVVAGLGAFYFPLAEQPLVLRVLAVLTGIAAGLAVMLTTEPGKAGLAFTREAYAEARKVVWPTRKETIQTTAVVFAMVIVIGLFLWVVDVGLMWAVKVLMGRST